MANNIDVATGEFFARFGTQATLDALARYADRRAASLPTWRPERAVWERIAQCYGRAARTAADYCRRGSVTRER